MKSAAAGQLESDSQVQFCIDLALAFFHLFRGSFKICLMLYCFGKQIWGKSGMVLCFAFFDQSIPFPQYYEISTKLDQTGTTAQVAS